MRVKPYTCDSSSKIPGGNRLVYIFFAFLVAFLDIATPRQQSTGKQWLAQEITQNELKISDHHQVVWLYRYFVDAEPFPFWGLIKYIA